MNKGLMAGLAAGAVVVGIGGFFAAKGISSLVVGYKTITGEAAVFAEEATMAIGAAWSPDTAGRYASPELVAGGADPFAPAGLARFADIHGPIEAVTNASCPSLSINKSAGEGTRTTTSCSVDARAENGPVRVNLGLLKRGERWGVTTIAVSRAADDA